MSDAPPRMMSGFGNHFSTEAVAGALPPWPEESLTEAAEDARTERETWRAGIAAALDPLAHALAEGAPLIRLVTLHRDAVAALTAGPEAPALAEAGEDGAAVARLTEALSRAADAYGSAAMPGAEYAALLDDLLAAETLRPEAARPHPRVQIWGTIEARVQAADLTILGGLNDGVWPAQADPGPWLSRPMRHALGLPEPERETGLSAHDFLQAAARPEVILTRARRAEGAPTVPSRWLVRLENLLAGTEPAALAAMKARGARFLALLPALDSEGAAPDDPALRPALRPQPAPPREARPRRLSVTQIERLLRDPYAIYARTVLGLRPLDPLGPAPDPLTRGTVLHAVLQRYVEETDPEADPAAADLEAAEEQLIATAECVLQETVAAPGLRRLWRGRILRAARWFVQGEAERRAAARPAALERAGRTSLTLPGGPFAITAKADRIDLRPDGRALV
ncbi:MAG: PD-(D/E)XK nuclease family protein, partial [Pseudomonadota bacterium]